ncbi:MAG: DUF1015 domain-containing protein [Oscillospiraceae bacterium]|nr:DUF1015 domain-containing protein [Oscillospiraceae bacterium]
MIVQRADILLPAPGVDPEKWSVIACDQHSSEPEYWKALEAFAGDAPSTLHLMLPEAYLDRDANLEAKKINDTMRAYLDGGVFREIPESYVYVERTLASGCLRRGLVGVIDLNAYDYGKNSTSPIRATEGTVEERLPARVKIRSGAALEMPHVMLFADDPQDHLFGNMQPGEKLYDFDLSAGGGHLTGYRITGAAADRVDEAFEELAREAEAKYAPQAPVVLAIGDGNHSLATAKKCGDRFALVEIVNIRDEAITFEPIHRVLFGTDNREFVSKYSSQIARIPNEADYADLIRRTDAFCSDYLARHGGSVDYIHNDDAAIGMGSREGCAAILLPALDKERLFESIVKNGSFPKKSFSIGHAADKRYYMECRKLAD